jgi:hypothetical protein
VFCASCGAAAGGGNFCAVCGVSLRADGTAQAPLDPAEWADEVRYDVIVAIPAVRDRIAENFAAAIQTANMQALMDRIDLTTASDAARAGVAWAPVLQKATARKGVEASGERAELRQRPVGWVLTDVLYVLAWCGYRVQGVEQRTHSCVMECVIAPSSRLLSGGTLVVTVERVGKNAGVRAVTHLPGLLKDWGASKRILDQFFKNLP